MAAYASGRQLRVFTSASNSVLGGFIQKTFSGCDGFARDPAKVEDQVRLLARTFWLCTR